MKFKTKATHHNFLQRSFQITLEESERLVPGNKFQTARSIHARFFTRTALESCESRPLKAGIVDLLSAKPLKLFLTLFTTPWRDPVKTERTTKVVTNRTIPLFAHFDVIQMKISTIF
jgi:hypothetical protein